MSDAKRAPSPWSVIGSRYGSGNGAPHVYIKDANDRKIAAIWGREDEKILTAELVAAAPDLYAALETVAAENASNKHFPYSSMTIIQSALAKARGEA